MEEKETDVLATKEVEDAISGLERNTVEASNDQIIRQIKGTQEIQTNGTKGEIKIRRRRKKVRKTETSDGSSSSSRSHPTAGLSIPHDGLPTISSVHSYEAGHTKSYPVVQHTEKVNDAHPWPVLPTYLPPPPPNMMYHPRMRSSFLHPNQIVPIHIPRGYVTTPTDGVNSGLRYPYAYYPMMPYQNEGMPVQFMFYPVRIPVNAVRPMMADNLAKEETEATSTDTDEQGSNPVHKSRSPEYMNSDDIERLPQIDQGSTKSTGEAPVAEIHPRYSLNTSPAKPPSAEKLKTIAEDFNKASSLLRDKSPCRLPNVIVCSNDDSSVPMYSPNKSLAEEINIRSAMHPREALLAKKRKQLSGIVDRVTEVASKKNLDEQKMCTIYENVEEMESPCESSSMRSSSNISCTDEIRTASSKVVSAKQRENEKLFKKSAFHPRFCLVPELRNKINVSNTPEQTEEEKEEKGGDLFSFDKISKILKSPIEPMDKEPWSWNTLSSSTISSNTLPSSTLPLSTLPLSTLPLSTLPLSTLPLSTLPSTTLHSSTLPSTTLASSTLSSTVLASSTLSSTVLASSTLSSTTLASSTLSSTTSSLSTCSSTALPSSTLPSSTLPSTALLSSTLPSSTLPSTTLASSTLPSTVLASCTLSSTVLASSTLSSTTLASSTLSSTTLASSTFSSTVLASSTLSSTTLLSTTLPSTTLASTTLASTTLASSILPSSTLSSSTLSSSTLFSNTLPSSTVSSNVISSIVLPSTIASLGTSSSSTLSLSTSSSSTSSSSALPSSSSSPSTLLTVSTTHGEKEKVIKDIGSPLFIHPSKMLYNNEFSTGHRKTPEPNAFEQKLITEVNNSINSLNAIPRGIHAIKSNNNKNDSNSTDIFRELERNAILEAKQMETRQLGNSTITDLVSRGHCADDRYFRSLQCHGISESKWTNTYTSPTERSSLSESYLSIISTEMESNDTAHIDSENEEYHALKEISILQSANNPLLGSFHESGPLFNNITLDEMENHDDSENHGDSEDDSENHEHCLQNLCIDDEDKPLFHPINLTPCYLMPNGDCKKLPSFNPRVTLKDIREIEKYKHLLIHIEEQAGCDYIIDSETLVEQVQDPGDEEDMLEETGIEGVRVKQKRNMKRFADIPKRTDRVKRKKVAVFYKETRTNFI